MPPDAGAAWSALRRVLPDQSVNGLAEEVDVTNVPGVLVMQVDEHPPGIGDPVGGDGEFHQPVQAAVGQHLGDRGPAPLCRAAHSS